MSKLRIADNLTLPGEAVTQTFAILAKRGVGKTYTASVMAEEMLHVHQPIVAIDPTGAWWGLRSSFPIIVLGGDHGDLPLEEHAGEVIASAIVENRFSAVLDLSLFRKGQMIRFMIAFAETLYRLNREAVHLFIDEADAFAPQGRSGFGVEENRMLGAMEDLVRRGRKRGLGCTLITQRPAVLNKNVLTQCESLFVMRLVHPKDIDAIMEWINVHAEPSEAEKVVKSLPTLSIGEGWLWSPGWLGLLQRIKIRKRETFDSSATPKPGEMVQAPKGLAKIDLDALGEKIKGAVQRAKDNDPRELKRRIADLEKQLRERPAETKIEKVVETVEVPVLKNGQLDRTEKIIERTEVLGQKLLAEATELRRLIAPAAAPRPAPVIHAKPVSIPEKSKVIHERPNLIQMADSLPGPQQRILDGLAWLESAGISPANRTQTGFAARYSPAGSAFTNPLGALRTAGLVEYVGTGMVQLTDAGRQAAVGVDQPATPKEFQQMILDRLKGPQARILRPLLERYPESMSREDLGAASGYSPGGSAFTNPLGALRSLGLVSYPAAGLVVALGVLFLE